MDYKKACLTKKIFSILSASKNKEKSVVLQNETIFHYIIEDPSRYLVGTKNTSAIDKEILRKLFSTKKFLWHRLGEESVNGQAIDMYLTNPITGNKMTGSSSGTAINVFLGINDLGVSTDGGGSTLYPAMSLNLYSFLGSGIGLKNKKLKKSTDNILFQTGIGFIAKELNVLEDTLKILGFIHTSVSTIFTCMIDEDLENDIQIKKLSETINITSCKNNVSDDRNELIKHLAIIFEKTDILIVKEELIDFYNYGDSIIGTYGNKARESQRNSNKKYGKVLNMLNLNAITVPCNEISSGYIIIGKANEKCIQNLFAIANIIKQENHTLSEKYFRMFSEDEGISFNL